MFNLVVRIVTIGLYRVNRDYSLLMNVFSAVRSLHEMRQIDVSTVRPPVTVLSQVSLDAVSLETVFTTVAVMTLSYQLRVSREELVSICTCQQVRKPLQACSYNLPRLKLKCISNPLRVSQLFGYEV